MLSNNFGPSVPVRNRHRKGTQWFAIVFGLALTTFLLVVLGEAVDAFNDYPTETVICIFIGGLSIHGQLLSLRREASIHFCSFVFCFLFMSAAPMVQLAASTDPVYKIDHWAFWAAMNAVAFTVIGVFMTFRMKKFEYKTQPRSKLPPAGINYLLLFLVVAATSGIAIALFKASLFTNREEFSTAADALFGDAVISLLAKTLLFYTPFFGALVGLRSSLANRKTIWIVLFSLEVLTALILNNPLINPRYQLASLAFFAVDYMFYGRKTKLLAVLVIVGVVLAPAFQVFRADVSDSEGSISQDHGIFSTTLLSKDYDAFQMSCYTMLTVDSTGVSWGSNILGAALFFVPRAWWPRKPPPTSWITFQTASHSTDLGTSNLSTPLMAEGYYAFGWIGALVISWFYWWGASRITLLSRRNFNSWAFLSRCLFAGLVLIFLRGTLTVGVSAVAGSFIAAAVPAFLIRYRFRKGGGRSLRHRIVRPYGTREVNPL
jgi:hypothetical protein